MDNDELLLLSSDLSLTVSDNLIVVTVYMGSTFRPRSSTKLTVRQYGA